MNILDKEIQQFIKDHENHDPFHLSLNLKNKEWPVKEIVQQIAARQKAKPKIPSWYHTEGIIFPPPVSIEQASSEVTAQFKFSNLSGNLAIDLTGGAGIDTYFMAGKYNKVVYVEADKDLYHLARHNFNVLDQDNVFFEHNTAEVFLADFSGKAD